MDQRRIQVPYNPDMGELEAVMARVRRPGDFHASGSIEPLVPRIEVEGVGPLSLPVTEAQARELVARATPAPHGRGSETVHDDSVRRTRQMPARSVTLGGKAWPRLMEEMLRSAKRQLGCEDVVVTAELYKLLVYEPGGFFKAHRDTEKTPGMFGTLVLALPSAHDGGELVVRHGGRQATICLRPNEFCEWRYAAFYADCEHEVLPVTNGHRVCLVFNLVRSPGAGDAPLRAPEHEQETRQATGLLRESMGDSHRPAKLAWLLQHQYSVAGLSFDALKGEDAAVAGVLLAAARDAGCVAHLAIVHIEENGPAEIEWRPRRERWGSRRGADEAATKDFDVVEVSARSWYVDGWVHANGRAAAYGSVPLQDREVLPSGALDSEPPDEQRVTEATGNTGASFERLYRRAALVLWHRDREVDVLLQAGVTAALPALETRITGSLADADVVACRLVDAWEANPPRPWADMHDPRTRQDPAHAQLLRLLARHGNLECLARFASMVSGRQNGLDTASWTSAIGALGPRAAGPVLQAILAETLLNHPSGCIRLGLSLARALPRDHAAAWREPLADMADQILARLPELDSAAMEPQAWWPLAEERGRLKPADVVCLLGFLRAIKAGALVAGFVDRLRGLTAAEPGGVLVPALVLMHDADKEGFATDDVVRGLWRECACVIHGRSASPPARPTDWRQVVRLDCPCEWCGRLAAFAANAGLAEGRFCCVAQQRQHIEQQVRVRGLDMTCHTETKGRPFTLVCVKTRGAWQRARERHARDMESLRLLVTLAGSFRHDEATWLGRLQSALRQAPGDDGAG